MDPNANLDEQRSAAAELLKIYENPAGLGGAYTLAQDARMVELGERLAELVQALDNWITSGAALPRAWAKWQHPGR
jgi:hypothetical protein